MAMLAECCDQFVPADRSVDRDDLAARHGDVIGIFLVEMKEVAQHLQLDRRQVPLARYGRRRAVTIVLVLVDDIRSEEHTSELQSLMRISYAVLCLKKKTPQTHHKNI